MNRDVIRFGLIGAGTVAGYGHMPALREVPGVELVLVADIQEAIGTPGKASEDAAVRKAYTTKSCQTAIRAIWRLRFDINCPTLVEFAYSRFTALLRCVSYLYVF